MIQEKINKAVEIIDPILKTKEVKINGVARFKFRGIDEVMAEINRILPILKMNIYCEKMELLGRDFIPTSSGSVQSLVTIKASYVLIDVEDGSLVNIEFLGEGTDNGDKAIMKATANAFKNMLYQTFVIPTSEKKDAEYDEVEMVENPLISEEQRKELFTWGSQEQIKAEINKIGIQDTRKLTQTQLMIIYYNLKKGN